MYWYMKHASEGTGYPTWVIQLFFIVMFVWMNCILFSLYLAMLLENFSVPEQEKLPMQKLQYDKKVAKDLLSKKSATKKFSLLQNTIKEDKNKGMAVADGESVLHKFNHSALHADLSLSENKSLYIFQLDSHFRKYCAKIQESKYFQKMVMGLIGFSCVSLALEGNGNGGSNVEDAIPLLWGHSIFDYLNVLVLGAFVLEGALKAIIHGFVFKSGPTPPYLTEKMNMLDFFIIVVCLASYLPFFPLKGPWARALRLARVVTPLMNLSKHPELAMVIIAFVRAAPDTAVILLPLSLVGLVFSIVGVASFGGNIRYCIETLDPRTPLSTGLEQFSNQSMCLNQTGYDWVSPPFNFDNSINGLLLLFAAMTDGTHPFMVSLAKKSDASTSFWVAFHLVFTCFFLNLFLGVLTASFEKSKGTSIMTIGEKQYFATLRMLAVFNPGAVLDEEELRPTITARCCGRSQPLLWYKVRSRMFKVATNEKVEAVFCWTIALNTIMLTTDMYPISHVHSTFVSNMNTVFLTIYTSEVVIKMVGFGARHYFTDGWMISDFVLVAMSVTLRFTGGQSGVESLRVLRVLRIIVLASKIPSLVKLIDIMIACMRASVAVVLLTSLTIYIYCIVGMALFGSLPTDEFLTAHSIPESMWEDLRRSDHLISTACPSCKAYSDFTNFNNFGQSFRLLVQQAFGQGISDVVADLTFLGANFYVIYGYLASFYMLTVWVFMNLLIVTVLSNFDIASTGTCEAKPIGPNDLDGFAHTWAALTIGVHRIKAISKTSESLLEQLKSIVGEHDEETISSVVEDGLPLLAGQLKVALDRVDGITLPKARVYAAVTVHSDDVKGSLTHLTSVVPTKKGSAIWPGTATKPEDEFKFHATGFHSHVTIELIDSFQFCDRRLGAIAFDFHKLREMSGETTLTVQLLTDAAGKLRGRVRIAGDKNRWVRLQSDWGEEEEAEEEAEEEEAEETDDPDEDDPFLDEDDGEEMSKVEQYEADELARNEQKALKAAKVRRKKMKKDAADEEVTFNDPYEGWEDTGMSITVRFEFISQMFNVPTTNFLLSHGASFHNMEPNCGACGWLEVAEFSKPFNRRFCYIQDEPTPCIKFHSNASSIDMLEALSMRGKLQTKTVLGSQILSVSSGHTVKTRKGINWQIEYEEPHSETGRTQEVLIGVLSGIVERADGLKLAKNKQNCVLIATLLSFAEPADVEEESENGTTPSNTPTSTPGTTPNNAPSSTPRADISPTTFESEDAKVERKPVSSSLQLFVSRGKSPTGGSKSPKSPKSPKESEEPGYTEYFDEDVGDVDEEVVEFVIEDEEDQVAIAPTRYMATKRAVMRVRSMMDSDQTGYINTNEVVTVTHTKLIDGKLRLRCGRGWISAVSTTTGWVLAIAENDANLHYQLHRGCNVDRYLEVHRASEADVITDLKKKFVVEVLEKKLDPGTQTSRLHIRLGGDETGWISEIDLQKRVTPAPYCVLEIEGNKDRRRKDRIDTKSQKWQSNAGDQPNSPTWGEKFELNVFASSKTVKIRVMDESTLAEMGSAEIELGDDGIPGAMATSGDIRLRVLTTEPATTGGTEVVVSLSSVTKEDPAGAPAGHITVKLAYKEIIPRSELVAAKEAASGDLIAGMMAAETRKRVLRFTAGCATGRRMWLAMARWVATSCRLDQVPRKLLIPSPPLAKEEMKRLERDITLIDLPFDRASSLMAGLYKRRVMGSVKPTMRRQLYALFQMEVHAWTNSKIMIHAKRKGRRGKHESGAVYLDECRGLSFDAVLKRLVLLHQGKQRCLSYAEQATEYKKEINHISLQFIKTIVGYWVFKTAFAKGRLIGGNTFPWHGAWKGKACVAVAMEATCAGRLRSLKILLGEVKRRSKPRRWDELPPISARAAQEAAEAEEAAVAAAAGKQLLLERLESVGLERFHTPLVEELGYVSIEQLAAEPAALWSRPDLALGKIGMAAEDIEVLQSAVCTTDEDGIEMAETTET